MYPEFRLIASLLLAVGLGGIASVAVAEHVAFREVKATSYELDGAALHSATHRSEPRPAEWIRARQSGHANTLEFGRRVVLRLRQAPVAGNRPRPVGLRLLRTVDPRTWVFEAADASAAIRIAATLSAQPEVEVAVPAVRRNSLRPHFPYAAAPNDRYYALQFALQTENLAAPYLPAGVDINARGAWPFTRGEGVTLGVADDGIELTHPDLAANLSGAHYNFLSNQPDGSPMTTFLYHGTAVAGLIAAVGDNRIGLTGVAPSAHLTSWVIFDGEGNLPDDAGMAAMFGESTDVVSVQNHSWGNSDFFFVERRLLEDLAIEKAVTLGRQGRGVILVRSAGNTRDTDYNFNSGSGDANLDGYANDPRQITVAAVRDDGHFASYSTPGSCVLVAAPSGDSRNGSPGLVTTDRIGAAGLNVFSDPEEPTSADYLAGSRRFSGTSASAPLVSGCVALILSANPQLGWRDIPQILALSARQTDLSDPDLRTNAAGFRVSHNTGFGVPDAGTAVRLAQQWKPQEAPVVIRQTVADTRLIPDGITSGTPGSVSFEFLITHSVIVQQVQVAVQWSHDRSQDLELILTSPSGTKSSLLRSGSAASPVPPDWIFLSVLHLGETSLGTWTVEFRDHQSGIVGSVNSAELVLTGRAIQDQDADGLDDAWEQRFLGSLRYGPREDPDGDGWINAAEQMAGSDPAQNETPFLASLAVHAGERSRLSWPATEHDQFEIWGTTDAARPFTHLTNAPGRFPESGWQAPSGSADQLYQVRKVP